MMEEFDLRFERTELLLSYSKQHNLIFILRFISTMQARLKWGESRINSNYLSV